MPRILSRNISIRTKLASLVALNVVVLGVVAFYCVRQVRCVRREIHEIADQDIPLTGALSALAQDQEDMDARLERVLRLAGLKPADDGQSALAAARRELARVDARELERLRDGRAVAQKAREEAVASGDAGERAEFDRVIALLGRVEKE